MRFIHAALAFGMMLMMLGPVLIVSATASRTPNGVSSHVKTTAVFQQGVIVPDPGYVPGSAGEWDGLNLSDGWNAPARWRVAKHDVTLRSELVIPSLVVTASKHLGTNPTGWARLWCARFVALIAPELAKKIDNPNLARSWAHLPKTKAKPGAIVVLTRGGNPKAGHIGIVKRVLKNGDVEVISGNTWWKGKKRTVGINRYSKRRVIAFVSA